MVFIILILLGIIKISVNIYDCFKGKWYLNLVLSFIGINLGYGGIIYFGEIGKISYG